MQRAQSDRDVRRLKPEPKRDQRSEAAACERNQRRTLAQLGPGKHRIVLIGSQAVAQATQKLSGQRLIELNSGFLRLRGRIPLLRLQAQLPKSSRIASTTAAGSSR